MIFRGVVEKMGVFIGRGGGGGGGLTWPLILRIFRMMSNFFFCHPISLACDTLKHCCCVLILLIREDSSTCQRQCSRAYQWQ